MSAAYRHCVNGLLTSIVWTLIGRLYDVYITDIVYLLDVLVVIVYMSYCNCWDYLLLHEDWGECSEDWAGACRWGGGEVEYLTEKIVSLRNVPGVFLEFFFPTKFFFSKMFLGFWNACKQKFIFRGGGGFWGVWGAPRPHPGVARGQKTIHFFLWPWHVTG